MKKTKKDYSVIDFYGEKISALNKDTYKKYFTEQKANDVWHQCYVNELFSYGLENNMITVRAGEEEGTSICESRVTDFCLNTITPVEVTVNASSELIQTTLEGDTATRLVLDFPTPTKRMCYPVARTARDGLYGRTGTGMTRVDNSLGLDTDKFYEFNPYARASFINEHARTFMGGKVQMLVRDNRLLAVHSDNYAILPIADLIDVTEDVLNKRYTKKGYEFVLGQTSNSFSKLLYKIEDPTIEAEVASLFAKTTYKEHKAGLLFTTSDTGTNCATVCCVLHKDDDVLIISKEHKLKHQGKVTPEDFRLEVEKCYDSVTEVMTKLENMANQSVYFFPDFVRRLGFTIGLNKKETCEYAQNLQLNGGTQFDAYLAICEIISNRIHSSDLSPEMVFELNEMTNEMFFIKNLSAFDEPFEWVDTVATT